MRSVGNGQKFSGAMHAALAAIPVVVVMACCGAVRLAPTGARPQPRGARPYLQPFGIGADAHTGATRASLTKWIPQMQAIGIRTCRSVNMWWGGIEPKPGKWNWANLDRQLAYMKAHHIQTGGLLLGNVKWDKKDRPGTLPVNDLPAWRAYVSAVVRHCQGKVNHWEVWNEPPNGTGPHQTPADYAKIVIATYNAAKAANPHCMVGLAAKSVDINYLEQAIRAGAKDHFDYITLHPYEALGNVMHQGQEAVFMSMVPTLRKMLRAVDPAQVHVPVVFTELGCNASPNPALQADALVKAYTMGIAQGVACIDWFEGMDGDSGPMGLLQANGAPRPAYTAMAQMIKYIGEHPVYLGWVLLRGKDYGFVFHGPHGPVLSAWAPRGEQTKISFGGRVRIINPLTGKAIRAAHYTLGATPILALGVPQSLIRHARADKRKPFPWDGSYTHAKSVSITMGKIIKSNGLHLLSSAAIAREVVAYGGSARSGNVPGGLVFEVDPNFLSYTPTPIEITALVRRDRAGDPARVILYYESPTSYEGANQKAPAYRVPAGKGWHKAVWKISNDQFVSMWGYNFRLNAGRYFIKRVAVKKLRRKGH